MPENTITIVGNLTADPEIRFTQNGVSVANVTIASTPRILKNGEWTDGDPLFLRGTVWKDAADNVANSLYKGVRVLATGRLKQRSWEDSKTGDKRTAVELEIDEIGPSLKFAQATVDKKQKAYSNDAWKSPDDNDAPF